MLSVPYYQEKIDIFLCCDFFPIYLKFSTMSIWAPSASNVGPLFSLIFNDPAYHESNEKIHPFIIMLNLRADMVNEWLSRFPLDLIFIDYDDKE